MALVLAFYGKKLHILYQRSHFNFIKMKYGEVLHICHISRIKPGAETEPEQRWRIAENMKCKFFKQIWYILETVSLETL